MNVCSKLIKNPLFKHDYADLKKKLKLGGPGDPPYSTRFLNLLNFEAKNFAR